MCRAATVSRADRNAGLVERGADAASEDVVVDGRFGAVGGVEQHACLQFDERVGVLDVSGSRSRSSSFEQLEWATGSMDPSGCGVDESAGQLADGRSGRTVRGRVKWSLAAAGPGEYLDTADGVAAEREIVIERSDPIDAQYFCKIAASRCSAWPSGST